MKILVKHIKNIDNGKTPQFLVYLMTIDNVAVSCSIADGESAKDKVIDEINNRYKNNKNGFTLEVKTISYL